MAVGLGNNGLTLLHRRRKWLPILGGGNAKTGGVAPKFAWNFTGTNSLPPGSTFTRALANATFFGSNGLLQTAAANQLRFDYGQNSGVALGALIEEAKTNVIIFNRDFTNAAWVKTTMTAALDQVGIDGAANSASSLLATAGNALALQTVVQAAVATAGSIYVKRLVGTGTINITQDGVGFTALSPAPSSTQWTRYELDATQLNPVFGLQIVTNGDKIAVDYAQLEAGQAATGAYATSPILTGAAAVTRNADILTMPIFPGFTSTRGTFVFRGDISSADLSINHFAFQVDDGTSTNRFFLARSITTGTYNASVLSATFGSWPAAIQQRVAFAYALNDTATAVNGAIGNTNGTYALVSGITTVRFGANAIPNNFIDGHIAYFAYYNQRLSNGQLVALTQ